MQLWILLLVCLTLFIQIWMFVAMVLRFDDLQMSRSKVLDWMRENVSDPLDRMSILSEAWEKDFFEGIVEAKREQEWREKENELVDQAIAASSASPANDPLFSDPWKWFSIAPDPLKGYKRRRDHQRGYKAN